MLYQLDDHQGLHYNRELFEPIFNLYLLNIYRKFFVFTSRKAVRNSPPGAIPNCLVK
jgi:hypothetical protein